MLEKLTTQGEETRKRESERERFVDQGTALNPPGHLEGDVVWSHAHESSPPLCPPWNNLAPIAAGQARPVEVRKASIQDGCEGGASLWGGINGDEVILQEARIWDGGVVANPLSRAANYPTTASADEAEGAERGAYTARKANSTFRQSIFCEDLGQILRKNDEYHHRRIALERSTQRIDPHRGFVA